MLFLYAVKVQMLHTLFLVAAYTRYLGDLTGGQILAKKLQAALQLPTDTLDGRQFYCFSHVDNIPLFKQKFKKAIDTVGQGLTPQRIRVC